jgi:DNA-binding MarR family transcriptional regulator
MGYTNDMDRTVSAYQVAQELGTSIPRVVRAAHKLCPDAEQAQGYAFTPTMVATLRAALGVNARVRGLTVEEARVLKALSSAPFGVVSARSLARRAHVSPTTATRTLESLKAKKLARTEERMIAQGSAKRASLIHADRDTDAWRSVRRQLQSVVLPETVEERAERVPRELQHLFWNTSKKQMSVADDGGYIARRLLERNDYNALAWGARNLSRADWKHAARARGVDAATRAMAENLAGDA